MHGNADKPGGWHPSNNNAESRSRFCKGINNVNVQKRLGPLRMVGKRDNQSELREGHCPNRFVNLIELTGVDGGLTICVARFDQLVFSYSIS